MRRYLEDKIPRIERSLQRFYDRLASDEFLEDLATIGTINPETFKKGLYEPAKEAAAGGKRIRPVLVYLTHDLVKGTFEHIDDLAILPELPHKGSVVIDDVEDEAKKRDHKEPLYVSYGIPTALNASNFLYFVTGLILDSVEIDDKRKLEILQDFFYEGLNAHIGQGSDIYWRETNSLPTEQEYLQMNAFKTSTFRFAVKLGAILGNANKAQKEILAEIAELTGTAYQLKDDLLSLDENAHDYGDDITEGKISLMALTTLQMGGEDSKELKRLLSLKTRNPKLIEAAIKIMRDNGSIEYAEQTAMTLAEKAIGILNREFPESEYKRIFSEIIRYGVSREK